MDANRRQRPAFLREAMFSAPGAPEPDDSSRSWLVLGVARGRREGRAKTALLKTYQSAGHPPSGESRVEERGAVSAPEVEREPLASSVN